MRPPSCQCGTCKRCKHAAYMRAYYAKNREHWLELQRGRRVTSSQSRDYERIRYNTDPDFRLRKIARNKVGLALRRGKIERQPCEVCQEHPTQAHHDDYSRPLDVRWLCVTHHREHHAAENAKRVMTA